MKGRTSQLLKVAAALLAAALLARFLRERFAGSGSADGDASDDRRQRATEVGGAGGEGSGAEARTVEGQERAEGSAGGEDEIRVRRTEEELAAGTREVEAGEVRVRKNVRTDRESVEVPTRHEEVSVERVPLSGEVTEAEIGEDEAVIPVVEEEVVVSKRPVVKEEVRIKKDVVEDTELVEEDVRREEIDVEDETHRRDT